MTKNEIAAAVVRIRDENPKLGFVQCVCRVERDVLRRSLTEVEQEYAEEHWLDTLPFEH